MGLKLFNTLTSRLEDFVPRGEAVGIYTCGLTVQGPPHVGHMRAPLCRDILVRWLNYLGYKVIMLENFTDVDDKIIEKQKEYKKDWRKIAEENIEKYLGACDQLNIKKADFYPRASQHIEEIIELVKKLVDKGLAYEKGGDVYFRVRKFPEYGKLSKKSIDELVAGARIEPTELKDDPLDFALWKAVKPDEPYWHSPWGKGRPGWHIECSAMSMHYLGESFDIHTGGEDLIFPHHENEIAQSVAATGKEFVRYWLHNGWVMLTGEKMSKSTGNYFLIEELLKKYPPNVIRLFLLKAQYRTQIEFSEDRMEEARSAYERIKTYLDKCPVSTEEIEPFMLKEFTEVMNDDLNTPQALGIMYELVKKGYEVDNPTIAASVRFYLSLLGFSQDKTADEISPRLIEMILDLREKMRQEKQYETSDEIRKRLKDLGIIIDDIKGSSIYRWEVK